MSSSLCDPAFAARLAEAVASVGGKLQAKGWSLALAESCTGGLVSHLVTNQPGCSVWYKGGLATYANSVKTTLLGVSRQVLEEHGAVSRETVEAMALGVILAFGTEVGTALSGIAGPTGGTPLKPVGTVWAAWVTPEGCRSERFQFTGSREEIKAQSALAALRGLEALLDKPRTAIGLSPELEA